MRYSSPAVASASLSVLSSQGLTSWEWINPSECLHRYPLPLCAAQRPDSAASLLQLWVILVLSPPLSSSVRLVPPSVADCSGVCVSGWAQTKAVTTAHTRAGEARGMVEKQAFLTSSFLPRSLFVSIWHPAHTSLCTKINTSRSPLSRSRLCQMLSEISVFSHAP